ncbi:hypothetical protein Tco_0556157 [Tanacetum coccineum]
MPGKGFILVLRSTIVWFPSFKAAKEADYCSDEDVNKDATNNIEDDGNYVNGDAESDVECVSDTVFADQEDTLGHVSPRKWQSAEKEVSRANPFNLTIFNMTRNGKLKAAANSVVDQLALSTWIYTRTCPNQNDVQEGLSSRVMEDAQLINAHDSPRVEYNIKTGGSILDVLENMIKVGNTMGFDMEGCMIRHGRELLDPRSSRRFSK